MVQSDLGADFSSFKLEDERHWAVTGTASADATFGMACCMSLAAEAQLRGHSSAMAQQRLDLALHLLEKAIHAGLRDINVVLRDTRLCMVRDLRPEEFGDIVQRMTVLSARPQRIRD